MSAQTPPKPTVAATPPMGWNSWDSYGLTITEEQFRANVKVLATELKPFGWNYAVIDEGWFFFNPEDRPKPDTLHYALDYYGRYVPVPARFPSAQSSQGEPPPPPPATPGPPGPPKLIATIQSTTFKPLADFVHAQGLKFGIHIVRGIPRASVERNLPIAGSGFNAADAADTSDACPWDPTNWGIKDNAAGQAWYDSLLSQYAGWGVDLLKVDCISDHPYKAAEIRMIRRAIDKTGRPIVLSLSPGPTALAHAEEVGQLANMWRMSDDIWDFWVNPRPWPRSVSSQFETTAAWAPYTKPGNWPDADMLPLGELRPVPGDGKPRTTRLTPAEQQTMLTLWSMARSPLILGANLTLLDDATYKLLINADLIRIDQTATRSGQVMHNGDILVWTADLPADSPEGSIALAIFNAGESQLIVNSSFEAFNLDDATYRVKDVWTGKSLGKLKSIQSMTLEPHACILWLLKK
ncbi:MAG TPA: glycoside hydrolase family 27 protein [Acidobacteriaceae bacterium]